MSNTLETFLAALNWRYATKAFDINKKVAEPLFNQLISAARLAPSSYGMQPWKFVVVKNPETRKKLREVAWNQPQITDASHLVVLSSREKIDQTYIDNYISSIAKERGVTVESLSDFKDMLDGSLSAMQQPAWRSNQVYIALGVLLMACANAGIDACPMEGFDRDAFNKILGLREKGVAAQVLCAVGYRVADDKYAKLKKVRFSEAETTLVL